MIIVVVLGNAFTAHSAAEAWVQRYSHPLGSYDRPVEIASDSAGDVIIAGFSDEGIYSSHFLINKYSGSGVALWTNRYDGPQRFGAYAWAMAIDSSDNVVVTGQSGNVTGSDYATVKYSRAGVPLWTNWYDGATNVDVGYAVATDSSGNVFVTGQSYTRGGSADYATVGYSAIGVPMWTNRYDGPSDGVDQPVAVAVNGNGNVFITGYSAGSDGSYDYVTIAYSGGGQPLWTNHYNGSGNSIDQAIALSVDDSTVIVTGFSWSGDDYDYVTVAYSVGGTSLWTNRYDGPMGLSDHACGLATDSHGRAFVTGTSSGSIPGFATIAYSSGGIPLWTNRYEGQLYGPDIGAAAIAVDAFGNVVVTGRSQSTDGFLDFVTVKYSGDGGPLWTNRYNGPNDEHDYAFGLAVDENGNVFVCGHSSVAITSSPDFTTVAYTSQGMPLWTNRYSAFRNHVDEANALVVDSESRVFVVGQSFNGEDYDFATIAYSEAGIPLWTNRYNGPGHYATRDYTDRAKAVTVAANGNVIVTGVSPSHTFGDYLTIAYSASGSPLWTNRYNGPGNSGDAANSVAVDAGGNVFVTGGSWGVADAASDYATVAYSGTGSPLWVRRYNGPANFADSASAMALDGQSNVFVTGQSFGIGSSFDYATVAYTADGVSLWTNRYNGPANGIDQANAIAVDRHGNVFITGSSVGNASSNDFATIAYSGIGVPLWTNRYNGPANLNDDARKVAVGKNGNVFVSGTSFGGGTLEDYATVAYSSAGVPLWTNRYNGLGNGIDRVAGLAIDQSGNVIVGGHSDNGSNTDYVIVAYSGAGIPLWTNRYDAEASVEEASDVAVDRNGNVFITGFLWRGNSLAYDFLTIKYSTGLPYLTIERTSSGECRLYVTGPPGVACRLERATTLASGWQTVATEIIPDSGRSEIRDTAAPPSQAFYRVVKD